MVVDHYAIDSRLEEIVGSIVPNIMVIDDLADRPHKCDLPLDQNWFGNDGLCRYHGLVPSECKILLWPAYALLAPEYSELRSVRSTRNGVVKRVLVFMGGSDTTNQTGKVIDAMTRPDLNKMAIDVVVGVNHPDPQGIARRVAARPGSNIFTDLPSLAGLMARADMMIGGGGSTTWERMCLGLPAVVISIADNQKLTNIALMKAGYIYLLGQENKVSSEMIAAAVRAKLADASSPRSMSYLSLELIKGGGAEILAEHLLSI